MFVKGAPEPTLVKPIEIPTNGTNTASALAGSFMIALVATSKLFFFAASHNTDGIHVTSFQVLK